MQWRPRVIVRLRSQADEYESEVPKAEPRLAPCSDHRERTDRWEQRAWLRPCHTSRLGNIARQRPGNRARLPLPPIPPEPLGHSHVMADNSRQMPGRDALQ